MAEIGGGSFEEDGVTVHPPSLNDTSSLQVEDDRAARLRGGSSFQNFAKSPRRKRKSVRTFDVVFPGLPLGIDVESAISQKNLFVKGSNDPKIHIGSQIIAVAGHNVIDADAPDIVSLIQNSKFPLTISFMYKPKKVRPSIRSPRSTARIEFPDGTNQLIPMNEMTVKAVTDFLWVTGHFQGQKEHYGMYVIDNMNGSSMEISLTNRSISEEVLDFAEDLALKRYEFRVKDEFIPTYKTSDETAFYGPWLTLDNEQVSFDIRGEVANFEGGRQCLLTWKGPNIVEMRGVRGGVFSKLCFINDNGQLEFKDGEIWVPNNANFLNVQSRIRQVSAAQILFDVSIKNNPIGMEYRIADTGEQVIISAVDPGSDADNAAVHPGDVVTTLNGKHYTDVRRLLSHLLEAKPPFKLQISRLRSGSNVGRHKDELSALPAMENDISGFLRIFVDNSPAGSYTCPCNIDTTVTDIRKFLLEHKGVQIDPNWSLFVSGTQELRQFKQVLDETNNPLEIRDAITRDGQYRVQFRFADQQGEDDDESESDSDYSSDLDEAVPEAPTYDQSSRALEKIASTHDAMLDAVQRLQHQNPDIHMNFKSPDLQMQQPHTQFTFTSEGEGEFTPMGEEYPADPAIVEERIALVEEAVRKQWLIAEALHDFDKETIQNWPDYSTLQSLQQGDMLLVSKRDPTGWWKGKNIMGGDYGRSPDGAYFPGSYVEVVAKPLYLARTLFEFDPNSVPNFPPNMVLLQLGLDDVLIVTDTHESGWWRGCNLLGGAEGYFPRDYVEITAQPDLQNDQWAHVFPNLKMKGFLDKKARVMRKWRQYFFVYEGEFLKYYENEGADPRNPLGKIRVCDDSYRSQVVQDKENFKKFQIKAQRKEWELRVTNANDRDLWCEALTRK